jgi:hypothetical protein
MSNIEKTTPRGRPLKLVDQFATLKIEEKKINRELAPITKELKAKAQDFQVLALKGTRYILYFKEYTSTKVDTELLSVKELETFNRLKEKASIDSEIFALDRFEEL